MRAQAYVVSRVQASPLPIAAAVAGTASSTADGREPGPARPLPSASAMPAATSASPVPTTTLVDGNASTSTKPVRKVPTSAPAVAAAERRPTTPPVSATLCSCSFATIGVTVLSTAAGRKKPAAASGIAAVLPSPRRLSPNACTSGTESRLSSPPSTSAGPSSRYGSCAIGERTARPCARRRWPRAPCR